MGFNPPKELFGHYLHLRPITQVLLASYAQKIAPRMQQNLPNEVKTSSLS